MKKLILLFLIIVPFAAKAQYTTTIEAGPSITPAVNYVYIGSITQTSGDGGNSQKLQVDIVGFGFFSTDIGTTTLTMANRGGLAINQVSNGGLSIGSDNLKIYQNGTQTDFYLNINSSTTYYSFSVRAWKFGLNTTSGMVAITTQTATPTGTDITSTVTVNKVMISDANGNISLNTSLNHGFKLAVNGNVIANSVTIQAYGNWPDYVFSSSYQLPPLATVKNYLLLNHHLPDMPSAAHIVEKGLNVGDINKTLTKKVEELTLYAIKQEETINAQQLQIKKLTQEFRYLKTKVEKHRKGSW